MEYILLSFAVFPFLAFLTSLLLPKRAEKAITSLSFYSIAFTLFLAAGFIVYWLLVGHPSINVKELSLYKVIGYDFFIDFYFDKITAVFLLVGSVLAFLIAKYSTRYMHRERGFKRFFNTLLFFYFGYNFTVISGNFETLFIGWEVIGISSFLLIAFYRNRYLPVKNAVKVFSLYRIGDVGILLAMWMSHHLWHENITFAKLNNYALVHEHLAAHSVAGIAISLMILLPAMVKSAQMPFSHWLPRAMEGPTPSSAIFYGSLASHIGVFLLLRTLPFWEHQISIRFLIAFIGLATALIASPTARVQSSIKAQVAYSSIAQIGLIFVEIAAGLENLALFHFAGNAFLRSYQLLISPSVVTYLIREKFYNYIPRLASIEDSFPKKIEYTMYKLSLKEWNLDAFNYKYLWNPLKKVGERFDFLSFNKIYWLLLPVFGIGTFLIFNKGYIPQGILAIVPSVLVFIGLLMVLKAFTERKKVFLSWGLVALNHVWIALAISFNGAFSWPDTLIYLSGIVGSATVGFLALRRLRKLEGELDLNRFHGHVFEHPKIAFVFLMSCLGIAGFPISPTFIGEDLIFNHVSEHQFLLAALIALCLINDGLAVIRIYARLFLGPHSKTYHEVAHRSA